MAAHTGTTSDEFSAPVTEWIGNARHPKFNRPYRELVYQPMLKLISFLRANGFKAFIVSDGGIEFMCPWSQAVYGAPPEQVIGSSIKTKFETRGAPVLVRLAEIDSSTRRTASRSAFSNLSIGDQSPPSAIPMATCKSSAELLPICSATPLS